MGTDQTKKLRKELTRLIALNAASDGLQLSADKFRDTTSFFKHLIQYYERWDF